MRDYSYSKLNLFESCPAAFQKKYIEKLPEAPSDALAMGSLIHHIIATYNQHCLKKRLETDITAMPEIVSKCFYEKPWGLTSDKYPEVLAMAERIAASHTVDPNTVVGIEEWVQKWLKGKTYLFRSIIDRLDIVGNTVIITDYKTDHQLRTQADVEADFQLAVYAWQALNEYPQVNEFIVRLDFVRHDVVREATLDIGRVVMVENQVLGLIGQVEQAISKNKFPARPGHFCGWCGYSTICPAAQNIPADVQPCATPEEAKKLAEELLILERQVAVRKESLKQYCNKAGFVEVNGVAWGFHPVESRSVEDVEAFVKIMNEAGRDPRPFLAVSGTKAKKLYGMPELQPILVDKSSSRFDSKKVKGSDVA